VRQGDKVHIHLVNDMGIAHGIDIQAAAIAPSKHFAPIPGKSDLSYDPDDKGMVAGDSKRMMDERPDFVVFNGVIKNTPTIRSNKGRPACAHLLCQRWSEPHFQLSRGRDHIQFGLSNRQRGECSTRPADLRSGPGNGAVFEFTVHETGDYPFVDHAIARAYKGAIGTLHAAK